MAIVLGLAVAATYGAADFLGGLATRRSPVTAVVLWSQTAGLPLLAAAVILSGGSPTRTTVALGALAGVAGAIGLTALYGGLAAGRMAVVAPITAVGAAVVPVLWAGLVQNERPSAVVILGILLALFAVALVSRGDDGDPDERRPSRNSILNAVLAGIGFGGVFILLDEAGQTGDDVGAWPLVGTRLASIALLLGLALGRRRPALPPHQLRTTVAAGLLDMTANLLYLVAARLGLLAIVAVLSSLYPASTVALARVVLHERLARTQVAGLALGLTGVVLMAAG